MTVLLAVMVMLQWQSWLHTMADFATMAVIKVLATMVVLATMAVLAMNNDGSNGGAGYDGRGVSDNGRKWRYWL